MSDSIERPKLTLGQVVITHGAAEVLSHNEIQRAITRHIIGDWGELCREDWELNNEAVRDGFRVMSSYQSGKGKKFWIITEWDRSVTTILLPLEY